ncbi:MAG: hypothetical protein HIU83_07145 [Proteobacteria bacterium]|nr:hypothetical protein [Pseudomonadota bacterium]
MTRALLFMLCALLVAAPTVQAENSPVPIGVVKTATGDAAILRDGRRVVARPGIQLVQGDVLATGASGSMGVILRDDTLLSLGASSETHLEQFVFEPVNQRFGLVVRVAHGMIVYFSGTIARRAPGSVRIETPVATLGVRGTYLAARIVP